MKTYQILETGQIIPANELRAAFPNVSFSDAEAVDPEILQALGLTSAPDTPDAPAPVPQSVTRRQARQALLLAGLLNRVPSALDAIADPVQRGLAQIEWADSQAFERDRPLLIALASALGLDDAALDALFVAAAAL